MTAPTGPRPIGRRAFLRETVGAGAALALAGSPAAAARPRDPLDLGIILGWMRDTVRADPVGTLERIASHGYRKVEFGDTYGLPAPEFLALLRRLGMTPVAGGGSMQQLRDDLPARIARGQELGWEYLVCYWPWLHDGRRVELREVYDTAREFNRIGEECRRAGMEFAFHNHDTEFHPVEGRVPYDVFLAETDPELVAMEIDLYWIRKGGGDVFEYFERYPGRFPLWHVKDMDATPEQGFETPGNGIIDFPAVFARAKQAGLRHFMVERDNAPEPMHTVRDAAAYLRRILA